MRDLWLVHRPQAHCSARSSAFILFAAAAALYCDRGRAARHIAIVLVINGIMVVGTQIFAGNTGILSFGHVGLAAIAAYITRHPVHSPFGKA